MAAIATTVTAGCETIVGEMVGARLAGEWKGTYTCVQGLTSLVLDIAPPSGGVATATFSFTAHPSNPAVATGSYMMKGTFDPLSYKLSLQPDRWVVEPPGYVMVPLEGMMSSEFTRISGTIPVDGCMVFEVSRPG